MFWSKKKSAPPPPPPSSPQPTPEELAARERARQSAEHAACWVATLKQRFEALLAQRAGELERLGLPAPLIPGELTYERQGDWALTLSVPAPEIPPHFVVHTRSDAAPPEGAYIALAAYVVTGSPEAVEAARLTYEQQGIIALRQDYPGVWVNEDPYEMYEWLLRYANNPGYRTHTNVGELNEGDVATALQFAFVNALDGPTGDLRGPLERLRDFTVDDLKGFERCHRLYNAFSVGRTTYSFDAVFGFADSTSTSIYHMPKEFSLFPQTVLFGDVPEPVFSTALVAFKILPADTARPTVSREFLDSLRTVTHPVAFELIDEGEAAYFQLVCDAGDSRLIRHQLELHFPAASVIEHDGAVLPEPPCITARPEALNAETRPLSDFPIDPFAQFFSLLDAQSGGHTTALQVLFSPVPNETMTVLVEALKSQHAADTGRAAARKMPAWQVTLQAFSSSAETLNQLRTAFFGQLASPQHPWTFRDEGARRLSARDMTDWALLSTAELATVAHLPTTAIASNRLETASAKAKLPPDLFTAGEVQIGTSEARGQVKPVAIPDSVRARHLYVVGKSGSGKSTLITNIAVQDIRRGEGVCVIDPHGDLVSDLLDYIPEGRVQDTIYFNVSDREHPIGLDLMSAKNEAEIEILTDDLVTTFRRLTETWGERMDTILRYSFNTLLRTPGATFLDLQKLLTNEGWRSSVVRKLNFPPLADFWYGQYPAMPKDAAQPILSRMTKIVLSPTLNAIFGRKGKTLNFNEVIRERKILLINLGGDSRDPDNEQLSVSDEMKKLIGSVVVSQIQLAAMRQASIPEERRVPCRLFVDEFQNFVSGAFPKILSEARKYKLSLTVAHQYISQLDDGTRNAVFGNVGTMVVMPLGQKDAAYLGAELGAYTPEDVANLSPERHEALCRPTTGAADTFLFTTLPPPQAEETFAQAVIDQTRAEYSAESAPREAAAPAAVDAEESPRIKRPMRRVEQVFSGAAEKILHFVSLAGYLTTAQIIELCYGHLSEASKRPAASRDLKKLTEAKRLKAVTWGDGKVYCAGGSCNPTTHNVAVRDIFVRIMQSGYEVAEVNFSATLGPLSPDLLVTFLAEDGSLLQTYWEYDTGTEGITEILKKIARYVPYSASSRVAFICTSQARVQAILKAIEADFVECAAIEEFTRLDAPAFISRASGEKYSFFERLDGRSLK